jgi:hypothetical protein
MHHIINQRITRARQSTFHQIVPSRMHNMVMQIFQHRMDGRRMDLVGFLIDSFAPIP